MIKLSPRINVNKNGKITTGTKVKNDKGVEYPKALNYFNLEDFAELKKIYGEQPKKIIVVFPTNNILDFFSADMVLYGSNNQAIRKCDGDKECIHRIDEELSLIGTLDEDGNLVETEPRKKKYAAGEVSECVCKMMPQTVEKNGKEVKNPKLCNCAFYLKAFVIDYKTKKIVSPQCYLFYSGSFNTASNIYSELIKIQTIVNGRIAGLPFGLSVDMVAGRTNSKVKYPIWNLQVLGTMAQLELAAESFLFDYREILKIGEGKNEINDSKILPEHEEPTQEDDLVLKKIKQTKIKAELNDMFAKMGDAEKEKYIGAIQDRSTELSNPTDGLFDNDEN